MIKTININLSGIVFNINEDAYDILNNYLTSIRSKFKNVDGGEEIIADIESRIAELFTEKLDGTRQVIEIKDVETVIDTLGKPEDYDLDEDDTDAYNQTDYRQPRKKKFFRNPDDKMLGGVSSGIAAYIDIDTVWVRLLWILLFFGYGFGFLFYVILWIIIPEAKTTADKLEMKGEPVNIENIEKKIKEEFEDIKDSFTKMGEHAKNADYAKAGKKAQNAIGQIVEMLITILGRIFKFLLKVIGIIFIFVGIVSIPAIIFGLTMAGTVLDDVFYGGTILDIFSPIFNSPMQLYWAAILLILVIFIPLLLIVLLGIRIITSKSKISTLLLIILTIIWFASASGIGAIAANTGIDHKDDSTITQHETLKIKGDTIILKAINNNISYGEFFDYDDIAMRKKGDKVEILFDNLNLNINANKNDISELRIIKKAQGRSKHEAKERVSKIDYNYKIDGNTIILNDYYSTSVDNKLRGQVVNLKLMLPIGTILKLDSSMKDLLDNVDNLNDLWGFQMLDHTWIMTEDGLNCLDCEEKNNNNSKDEFY
jgi:phage shock protein PspC (stress-responsive transcriptional regulator)